MTNTNDSVQFEADQRIVARCRYYVGKIGSLFYETMQREKKILGSNCRICGKVYWPPRGTCGRCFRLLTESDLVEIGPEGTLDTFTRIDYHEPVHPRSGPIIYGIIRLDGSDSGIAHMIDEVDYPELKIGMRMKPVFSDEPIGNILHIKYFKPA